MLLPTTIADPSPLDPLLLLPLPDTLPPAPGPELDTLLLQLGAHLDALDSNDASSSATHIPLPVLSASMRQANRHAQILMNSARGGAADARGRLDDVDVGLRTAEYELARVRDEMALCMEYEPMYEAMDMPDEDEFVASAAPEVLEALPADAEARKYALIIARLETELASIVAREADVASLTAERDGLLRSKREVRAAFMASDVFLGEYARTTNAVASKLRSVSVTKAEREKEKERVEREKSEKEKSAKEGKEGKATSEAVLPGSPAHAAPSGPPAS